MRESEQGHGLKTTERFEIEQRKGEAIDISLFFIISLERKCQVSSFVASLLNVNFNLLICILKFILIENFIVGELKKKSVIFLINFQ